MVRKENFQGNANSLLRTATGKRLGAGKFASIIFRGTAKPPVKKVKFGEKSDDSRVSDLTASVIEDVRPTYIKEVKADDIDVESSILGMSTNGESVAVAKDFGKENPLAGIPKATTPQPSSFKLPPRKDGKPVQKKSMEIQPGIRISAPSPMSLDRIQVQMGQEHTAPESEEYRKQQEEKNKLREEQLQKEEQKKAKKEAFEKLKEDYNKEIGEGFELQLENEEIDEPEKKKSLMKKILGKIRPKSPKKLVPMTANQARALARQAMRNSKKNKQEDPNSKPSPSLPPQPQLPLQEITVSAKNDSVSDLDSSGRRRFPVREIHMGDGDQSRDDESVSTLGTAHVLERMRPTGPLSDHQSAGDIRDPMPSDDLEAMGREEMFHPFGKRIQGASAPGGIGISANALIDQIDSGTLTEDAEAVRNPFACASKNQHGKFDAASPKPVGYGLSAMCLHPGAAAAIENSEKRSEADCGSEAGHEMTESVAEILLQQSEAETKDQNAASLPNSPDTQFSKTVDGAMSHVREGMADDQRVNTTDNADGVLEDSTFSGIDLKKTLSPIEEDEDFSPVHGESLNSRRDVPDLEVFDPENPISINKRRQSSAKQSEEDPEDIIDLTNLWDVPFSPTTEDGIKGDKKPSPATFDFDDFMDIAASKLRLKNEGDRYAVEGDDSPRQVIHGHDVNDQNLEDESIPVVRGIELDDNRRVGNETTPKARGSVNPNESQDSPQSSFEVYEHPEGEIVMWSENPVRRPELRSHKQTPKPNEFTGHFSDGLFDLLSMDESVNRGRKKVPFLSQKPATSDVGKDVKQESLDFSPVSQGSEKPCMFDFVGVCGKDRQTGMGDKSFQGMASKATRTHTEELNRRSNGSDDVAKEPKGDNIDPDVGVMCGAVPLYFMYATQKEAPAETETLKKVALRETDEIGKAEVEKGQEGPLEQKMSKETSKKEKGNKEGIIEIEHSLALKAVEESTSKAQPRGFLPMASSRNDVPFVEVENKDLQTAKNASSDQEEKNELLHTSNAAPQPAAEKSDDKVLLEGDDSYWDALSTIASTKDKSLESLKILTENFHGEPGPIPVEITMNGEDDKGSGIGLEMTKTRGKLSEMMDEEMSTDSLSKRISGGILTKTNSAKENFSEAKIIRLDDMDYPSLHLLPQSNYYHYGSDYPMHHIQGGQAIKHGPDEVSDDNSGLLLTVTRSENDDVKSPCSRLRSIPRGHRTRGWNQSDANNFPQNITNNKSPKDCRSKGEESIEEAVAHIAPKRAMSENIQPTNIAPESNRLAGLMSYLPPKSPVTKISRVQGMRQKQFQPQQRLSEQHSTSDRSDCVIDGRFSNPWNKNTRSVSWGFEEIYEDSDTTENPSVPPSKSSLAANGTIMYAAAEAAASNAVPERVGKECYTHTSGSSGVRSASTETKDISDDDEQQLISRTLELSKQLLASMTAQDLEGADDQVVKSLMSFGTEATSDRSSLSETSKEENASKLTTEKSTASGSRPMIDRDQRERLDDAIGAHPPVPEDRHLSTQKVTEEPMHNEGKENPMNTEANPPVIDSCSDGRESVGAVADPQEIAPKTAAIPASVRVKEINAPLESPTSTSIRPLAPTPKSDDNCNNEGNTSPKPQTVRAPSGRAPRMTNATKDQESGNTLPAATEHTESSFSNLGTQTPNGFGGGEKLSADFQFPAVFHVIKRSETPDHRTLHPSHREDRETHWRPPAGSSPVGFLSGSTEAVVLENDSNDVSQTNGSGRQTPLLDQSFRTDSNEKVLDSALTDSANESKTYINLVDSPVNGGFPSSSEAGWGQSSPISTSEAVHGPVSPASTNHTNHAVSVIKNGESDGSPTSSERQASFKGAAADPDDVEESIPAASSNEIFHAVSPASTNHTDHAISLLEHEEEPSVEAASSGQSEESPINVEALFSKYDNLANHLIEENTGLKTMAQGGMRTDETEATSSSSPRATTTRLDQLRAQRAEALAKLHNNRHSDESQGIRAPREKDRLSNYGRTLLNPKDIIEPTNMTTDLETSSATSDRTTASMKARELRRQLDQALQASHTIRQSQAQLETELKSFKTRFYKKNDALEEKAMRAIGGL